MHKLIFKTTIVLLLFPGLLFLASCHQSSDTGSGADNKNVIPGDDTTQKAWDQSFELVKIPSGMDHHLQKAYFYRATSSEPRPLLVSLHTWSGDYSQSDNMARVSKKMDLNYIHPNFRGPNNTEHACCSKFALNDIDDAISYALAHSNTDTSRIFVIGGSGGGYATLGAFMKSKHPVRKFSAWVPISDLVAWYHESWIRENKYAEDILNCTGSRDGTLDTIAAKERSPIYWETPVKKLSTCHLSIYTGIYDGIRGSVPITQSINFYNKILTDLSVTDSSKYVSDQEKLALLEHRKPLGDFGYISDREVFLRKAYGNLKLTVFEGGHDKLDDHLVKELFDQ